MIGYLKGQIKYTDSKAIIVNVNGVGYRVEVGKVDYLDGQEVELYIHTHVREQELRLFGFKSQDELNMFIKLMDVQGVGPKVAMTLVSELGLERILFALESENPHALKVSGVGLKTAEKIVLEMRGKEIKVQVANLSKLPVSRIVVDEAISALEGLGYKEYEVRNELSKIGIQQDWGSEDIIKELLKRLSRNTKKN
jgi:holliday junction DNA helicase RuvA